MKRYIVPEWSLTGITGSQAEVVRWSDVEKARQQLKKKCSQILTRYQIQEVIDEVLK